MCEELTMCDFFVSGVGVILISFFGEGFVFLIHFRSVVTINLTPLIYFIVHLFMIFYDIHSLLCVSLLLRWTSDSHRQLLR